MNLLSIVCGEEIVLKGWLLRRESSLRGVSRWENSYLSLGKNESCVVLQMEERDNREKRWPL